MAQFTFGVPVVAKAGDGKPMSLAAARRRVQEMVSVGEPLLIEGVASSTAVDNEGEWFSSKCLESMATQGPVDLVPCPSEGKHWGVEPGRELGVAKSFAVFEEGDVKKLGVEGELSPEVEQARAIMVNMLAGQSYQLSVTGPVKAAFGRHPVTGKSGRYFEDIRFDHIAVTRGNSLLNPAANPDTWLAAVSKAASADAEVGGEVMPYGKTSEIDEKVRKVLPEDALRIYMGAFNAAFKEVGEARAHAVAWAAVKKKYKPPEAEGGKWVAKSAAEEAEDEAFGEAVEAVAKAGARHSRRDHKLMHEAIRTLMDACGCGSCADSVAALVEAEDAASKAAEPSAPEAGNEESEDMTPEQIAEVVAKAVGDAVAPLTERLAALEAVAKSQDEADAESEKTDEEQTEETPAPEAEAEKLAEADAESVAEPEAEPDAEPEVPEAVAKSLSDLKAENATLAAKVTALEAQPTAGGPVSTAAAEDDTKLTGTPAGTPFADAVAKARANPGTVEAAHAAKAAEKALGDAAARLLMGQ